MADVHSKRTRSKNMSAVKSGHTKPERKVRELLFSSGFRYRLHNKLLPGKPDMVLARYQVCLFVNGCFWHMHSDCSLFTLPQTRREFWENKLLENVRRDTENYQELLEQGWNILVVWECALRGKTRLTEQTLKQRISELVISASESSPSIQEIR